MWVSVPERDPTTGTHTIAGECESREPDVDVSMDGVSERTENQFVQYTTDVGMAGKAHLCILTWSLRTTQPAQDQR